MKECTDTNNFSRWPFVEEEAREDGGKNNGSIDLISSPELIEKIHEATNENGLRSLIKLLNTPDSPFMTLGCSSGPGEDGTNYYSYLEFTLRDQDLARSEPVILSLHKKWLLWLSDRCQKHPEIEDALKSNVVWEYREFSLRRSAPQFLITIYPRTLNETDHGSILSWVNEFLGGMSIDKITKTEQ